jgi:hypothetical protein
MANHHIIINKKDNNALTSKNILRGFELAGYSQEETRELIYFLKLSHELKSIGQ